MKAVSLLLSDGWRQNSTPSKTASPAAFHVRVLYVCFMASCSVCRHVHLAWSYISGFWNMLFEIYGCMFERRVRIVGMRWCWGWRFPAALNAPCYLASSTDARWPSGCGRTTDTGLGTDGAKRGGGGGGVVWWVGGMMGWGHSVLSSNLPATGISVFT